MTTSQHLAVMRLMEKLDTPSRRYNRCLRRAWQTLTGSTENEQAIEQGNAALLEIEAIVREWVAANPAPTPAAARPVEETR